mmetsp:Transcript_37462/g.89755  ORF Transcript_37462/g.89755 Transcript_37462/m.89755 type:complete len:669 (+) Transcript_37462:154-2160(+)
MRPVSLFLALSSAAALSVPRQGTTKRKHQQTTRDGRNSLFPSVTLTRCRAAATTPSGVDTGSPSIPEINPLNRESNEAISATDEKNVTRMPSKLRQLKDRMWVRETLEDVTAAQFASSLSLETDSDSLSDKSKLGPKKRAVDFENVINKLDRRVEQMCVLTNESEVEGRRCYVLNRRIMGDEGNVTLDKTCYALSEKKGMGRIVFTMEEREELLSRLFDARERLVDIKSKQSREELNDSGAAEDRSAIGEIRPQHQQSDDVAATVAVEDKSTLFDPSLYVRDDGTIDWDGALQDREALKKFGSAVWSRINGRDPEEGGDDGEVSSADEFHSSGKAVTAKIPETVAIREKKDQLDRLKKELNEMETEHTKLLNSALSAGQAVANVNFATIDPILRVKIRTSLDQLDKKRAEVSFQMLNYELERIYTYLEGELGNTAAKGYIPLQDRLNVAELGLLESQVESFNRQIELGESLDDDMLSVLSDQLVDFKRRLGIDYYVQGLTFDTEAIKLWLKEIWTKTKDGLAFYVKGVQLFKEDILFCSSLVGKSLQGYTLKPREVRTLRRTFKDTITFVPVIIILLIPLSPIGHVLVFGAIQRVFPDFFPSCFTERRQNLLELYESTEYSAVTINETWQQQLVRMQKAVAFFMVKLGTQMNMVMSGENAESDPDNTK